MFRKNNSCYVAPWVCPSGYIVQPIRDSFPEIPEATNTMSNHKAQENAHYYGGGDPASKEQVEILGLKRLPKRLQHYWSKSLSNPKTRTWCLLVWGPHSLSNLAEYPAIQ